MDRLKYISTERMMEGLIVEITDGGVVIDLKGRLGQLRIPKRMLITDYPLQLGQEVGFMMSFPEVLAAEPIPKYQEIVERRTAK